MPPATARHLLLTGPPGCGKTTVLQTALDLLARAGWQVWGFLTPEVREGGRRVGFDAQLVSGERAPLARREWNDLPRVGAYGVRLAAIESFVIPEIERGIQLAEREAHVVVAMDEIGKMELLCPAFAPAVVRALASPARVLATIMVRPHPAADRVKARADVRVMVVTPQNRDRLPGEILREWAMGAGDHL